MKEIPAMQAVNVEAGSIRSDATSETSKTAVTAIGIAAALIGVWAVACMVAGMLNSGGPVSLVSNLFEAIFG